MPTATVQKAVNVGGVSISRSLTRTADHPNSYEVSLPAGKSGTLSTRTSDVAGVLTVASGHGITTSDTLDVYWDGGVAYGATVSATTATTITFASAGGDVLPAQDTAIVGAAQVQINTQIDGDAISVIGIEAVYAESPTTGKAHLDMRDSGNATIEEIDLVGNEPKIWDITAGDTNVFTGNPITYTEASNGHPTLACTLKIACLEDSTP